jgi:hypothetical protein
MSLSHCGEARFPYEANRELVALSATFPPMSHRFWTPAAWDAQIWGYEKWRLEILQQRCLFGLLIGKFAAPIASMHRSGFPSSVAWAMAGPKPKEHRF